MPFSPLVSIAAGLASAVLFISAVTGGMLGAVLPFLSSFPIAIAGLGWGWLTSLAAVIAASTGLLIVSNAAAVVMHALAFGLPMVGAAYLLSLRRELTADDGSVWVQNFPVGHVLAAFSVYAGMIATVAIGSISQGFDEDAYRQTLEGLLSQFLEVLQTVNPEVASQLTAENRSALVELAFIYLPGSIAIWFLLVQMLNLWLGAGVAAKSDRLQRTWPNFSALVLPRTYPILFVIAAGASFLSGMPGLIGSAFASAFVIVYALIGLGIVQQATRSWTFGLAVRAFAILSLFFLTRIASLILATLALAELWAPWRRTVLEDEPQPLGGGSARPPSAPAND